MASCVRVAKPHQARKPSPPPRRLFVRRRGRQASPPRRRQRSCRRCGVAPQAEGAPAATALGAAGRVGARAGRARTAAAAPQTSGDAGQTGGPAAAVVHGAKERTPGAWALTLPLSRARAQAAAGAEAAPRGAPRALDCDALCPRGGSCAPLQLPAPCRLTRVVRLGRKQNQPAPTCRVRRAPARAPRLADPQSLALRACAGDPGARRAARSGGERLQWVRGERELQLGAGQPRWQLAHPRWRNPV